MALDRDAKFSRGGIPGHDGVGVHRAARDFARADRKGEDGKKG
jgi:hypothetical protein